MDYQEHYDLSIADPARFWSGEASQIEWQTLPRQVMDDSGAPFTRWFVGGKTNLCHNAVDRHLKERADQPAMIFVSTETGIEKTYTYSDLHTEVQRMAAVLLGLGAGRGDRVLLYLPMIPEAVFTMLACARIGAIHCVVFGGFGSGALARRIEDVQPRVIVSADAGVRAGKRIPYKPLLDEAIDMSAHKPSTVVLVDRGLMPMKLQEPRDMLFGDLADAFGTAEVPCTWLESNEPSYVLYTSGTTGKPKGVQRDTGGYAVALTSSVKHIFDAKAGETIFCTSDVGWVVGHGYIVYGPLLAGMTTILYEGTPTRGLDGEPDAGFWWRLVEKFKVSIVFSAPTALRLLKQQDPAHLHRHDTSSMRAIFLAGEPLDEPTGRWISESLRVPVVDNYWQTETGWPVIALPRGLNAPKPRPGSPGLPVYGWNVKLIDDASGEEIVGPSKKGLLALSGPTPPGFMQTLWRDDERFVDTYWMDAAGQRVYSTFDWGTRDEDGYIFILGRSDDVINIAGHRLGTREIEECIAGDARIADVAVVGVADALKGQVPVGFATPKNPEMAVADLANELTSRVTATLGAIARPSRVYIVEQLPKTRSGKTMRLAIQAICEGRDPGDISALDDPSSLEAIQLAVKSA